MRRGEGGEGSGGEGREGRKKNDQCFGRFFDLSEPVF